MGFVSPNFLGGVTILRSPVSGDYHQEIRLRFTKNWGSWRLHCTRRIPQHSRPLQKTES